MKYRSKPKVIEAVQWTGNNLDELCRFVPAEFRHNKIHEPIGIITLNGPVTFTEGEYIVKGIQGEFYPCKADIFEATYEILTPIGDEPEEK